MSGAQNWQFVDPFGVDVSMAGRSGVRTPEAQYPDGYITPMQWRRGPGQADVAPPLNSRDSYDRGNNKHTKLPPEDYFWPGDFSPTSRIMAPVRVNADGLPERRRMAYQGTTADRLTARASAQPGWMGTELSVYTDRPPWSKG